MPRITKTFYHVDGGMTFDGEAYTDDGKVWRWTSNDRCVPLDAAEEYGIPIDKDAQKTTRDAEVQETLTRYREQMMNHVPSDEEMFEMRAAFGPGQKVVNIITGQEYDT